jgi:hypothetical protein
MDSSRAVYSRDLKVTSSKRSAVISTVLCSWRQWAANDSAAACSTIEIRAALYGVYLHQGVRAALDRYRELRRGQPDKYDFSVNEILMRSSSRAIGTSTTPLVRLC